MTARDEVRVGLVETKQFQLAHSPKHGLNGPQQICSQFCTWHTFQNGHLNLPHFRNNSNVVQSTYVFVTAAFLIPLYDPSSPGPRIFGTRNAPERPVSQAIASRRSGHSQAVTLLGI
jgi:hypothetical protein